MFKKILWTLTLYIIIISSISFATIDGNDLSIYLNDSTNLKTYFDQEQIELLFTSDTIIQNANPRVVVIDDYYNIETRSVGKTILVVVNGNDLTTLTVEVKSPVKEIQIDETELTILLGEIYPLSYELIPQNDYFRSVDQRLIWTNSKNNIVGVKGNNKLYTYSVGTTTLTGTTPDGALSIHVSVKVIGNPNNLIIKPDVISSTVKVGELRQLRAFFDTKDVTTHIEWQSQYPEILTIDKNGLVTPLKSGTCQVTAQSSQDRKKEHYTFFVKSMVDSITLDRTSIILEKVGSSVQLNAKLTYTNSDMTPLLDGYYYESSNPSVATVDKTGNVTAQGSGIALISVISYDSEKKDNCTIEVIGESLPTSIDYTLVRKIDLSSSTDQVLIGQKLLLDYKILPENATIQSVKFHIKNGKVNQIHYIDGNYYFIPEKRGNIKIKIAAENDIEDIEDEIQISVVSPIASLNLELALDRGSKKVKKLYIGEQTEILTEILTQGHYSNFDVYPNTLKYSIDDPDVLQLDYLNGSYYITALKKGSTSIRLMNIEDRHEESLKIDVLNPISKLSTDREVTLPIDLYYAPSITYAPTTSAAKETNFNITKGLTLKVDEFYFGETYIEEELLYEKKLIEYFKTLPSNITVDATIMRHATRLNRLRTLKNSASDGYCLVKNTFLKDRNFNSYRYFTISDTKIAGHYPSKAKVNLSIKNSGTNTSTVLYWQNNTANFKIKPISNWIDFNTLLSKNGLTDELSSIDNENKIKHLVYYISNKSYFTTKPTLELLSAYMALDNIILPTTIKKNLDAVTTKQELAYIAMYLDNVYKQSNPSNTNDIIYYDVINETVKQAIAKGYVQATSLNYFGISDTVTYDTFKDMVDGIYSDNKLPDSISELLTHEQLILLLNQI